MMGIEAAVSLLRDPSSDSGSFRGKHACRLGWWNIEKSEGLYWVNKSTAVDVVHAGSMADIPGMRDGWFVFDRHGDEIECRNYGGVNGEEDGPRIVRIPIRLYVTFPVLSENECGTILWKSPNCGTKRKSPSSM